MARGADARPFGPGSRDMRTKLCAGLLAGLALAAGAVTTAPVAAQAAAQDSWINVTGNLAHKLSECGTLTVVSAQPGSDRLIAGVALRGLWSSTTDGTWVQIGTGPGSERVTHRPVAVVYDPENSKTFWVSGLYNTFGVYRTTDGGETFKHLGTVSHNDTVSVDFSDPDRRTLLAGAHERGHTINKSIDGGETWENVGESLPANAGWTTHPFVLDGSTFLVNAWGQGAAPGIFRSTDGGLSWQQVSTSGPTSGLLRASTGMLYWVASGRMLRSTNQGLTWTAVGSALLGVRPVELPDKRIVAVGETTLVVSTDSGNTWVPLGGRLPYAPDGLTYSPERGGFYISRGNCTEQVPADAVMKLPFATPVPAPSTN